MLGGLFSLRCDRWPAQWARVFFLFGVFQYDLGWAGRLIKHGPFFTSRVRCQKLAKKRAPKIHMVAPILMAATPADPAGGGGHAAATSATGRHHNRRGERRSSFPSFPLAFPIMCPNANRSVRSGRRALGLNTERPVHRTGPALFMPWLDAPGLYAHTLVVRSVGLGRPTSSGRAEGITKPPKSGRRARE